MCMAGGVVPAGPRAYFRREASRLAAQGKAGPECCSRTCGGGHSYRIRDSIIRGGGGGDNRGGRGSSDVVIRGSSDVVIGGGGGDDADC